MPYTIRYGHSSHLIDDENAARVLRALDDEEKHVRVQIHTGGFEEPAHTVILSTAHVIALVEHLPMVPPTRVAAEEERNAAEDHLPETFTIVCDDRSYYVRAGVRDAALAAIRDEARSLSIFTIDGATAVIEPARIRGFLRHGEPDTGPEMKSTVLSLATFRSARVSQSD